MLIEPSMRRLRRHFTRAAQKPYADPEDIHQLRVYSRRAGAALRAFSGQCRSRDRRPLAHALKDLRGVAGQARDCDVFIGNLRGWREIAAPESLPAVTFLIGVAQGERTAAQSALQRAFGEVPPKELGRRWQRVSKSLRNKSGTKTLGDLVESVLQPRIESVLAAVDQADPTAEQLHAVRIEGKRARYTLELFAGCLDAESVRRGLEALAELQEILGSLNDSTVTLVRLEELQQRVGASDPDLWTELKPGFDLLATSHHQNQASHTEQYRGHRERLCEHLRRVQSDPILKS